MKIKKFNEGLEDTTGLVPSEEEKLKNNYFNELIYELQNVAKRYQPHMDASDIRDALIAVSSIYKEE